MNNNFFGLKILTIVLIFALACKNNKLDIDTSNINLKVNIKRYEKELFNINLNEVTQKLKVLSTEYPFFIDTNNLNNPVLINELIAFINDVNTRQLYNDCIKKYPDMNDIEKELTEAYKHYKFYYPKLVTPNVYTYISGIDYENKIIYNDTVVAIALDMYLGKDYYTKYGLPNYQAYTLRRESIAVDCIKEISKYQFRNKKERKDILTAMIHNGKLLYFLDAIFPNMNDTLKIGYTSQQLKWCEFNELNIWTYFIDKKILYSNDNLTIKKYIDEGPFTVTFPKESPAKIGCWIGWQIIRKYMNENPEVTLNELMNETDVQKILAKSKYRPKNK